MWLTTLKVNPDKIEDFLARCRVALSVQTQSMLVGVVGVKDLPLEKPLPEVPAVPDLYSLLVESLAQNFPNAPAPTKAQAADIQRLAGSAHPADIVADIMTILPRIVAKRPTDYIGHTVGIIRSLNMNGYESLHNEAAAIRRSGATDPNVARQQTNQRLEREPTAAPPAVNFDALLALRRDQLLEG